MERSRQKKGKLPKILAAVGVLAVIGSFSSPKESPQEPVGAGNTSVQTVEPVAATQTASNDEHLRQVAYDFLSEEFQVEMTDFQKQGYQFNISGTMDGVSNREDQSAAPENWDQIQRSMISAQARMKDALDLTSATITLALEDSEGDKMLLIQNGKISYDKYKIEDTEPDNPSSSENSPDPTPTVTEPLVWLTSGGSKYHTRSSCSNMESPTQVTISEARARGYTACKRCA